MEIMLGEHGPSRDNQCVCVHNEHVINLEADCPWFSSYPQFFRSTHSEMPRLLLARLVRDAYSDRIVTRNHIMEERNPKITFSSIGHLRR